MDKDAAGDASIAEAIDRSRVLLMPGALLDT
jgi:hypothetical protein